MIKPKFLIILIFFINLNCFALTHPAQINPAENTSRFSELKNRINDETQSLIVRWQSIISLATEFPDRSGEELNRLIQNPLWFLRNAALLGLEKSRPQEALAAARKLLVDKALVVRSAAVQVLSGNLQVQTRDLLWQELFKNYNYRGSQSLWIRAQIVRVLSQNPLDHEIKIFNQLLKEKNPEIQYSAVLALERLKKFKLGQEEMPIEKKVSLWRSFLNKNEL